MPVLYFAAYFLSYTGDQTSCSSQALFSKNITIDLVSQSMKQNRKIESGDVKDFKEIHVLRSDQLCHHSRTGLRNMTQKNLEKKFMHQFQSIYMDKLMNIPEN